MLSIALLTSNLHAAGGIEQLTDESDLFRLRFKGSPIPSTPEVIRALRTQEPDVILVDLTDWDAISFLVGQIRSANVKGVIVGFRGVWNRLEQLTFEEAGVIDLLHEPFSHSDLEAKAYEALHRARQVTIPNLLAFLPAKAGAGCSTVALHTAAALAKSLDKKVLLLETDRRSGPLSIMLNQQNRTGLSEALQQAGTMTPGEWLQHCVQVSGIDLLLANPARPGPLPSWADYYQILRFVGSRYDSLVADMPEIINSATAEIARSARAVFIVCTPDVPSLLLATQRRAEVASCDVSKDKIHIILNRWEKSGLSLSDAEKTLGQPVFVALPNDYKQARAAILESRLISPDSAFAKSCVNFGRTLMGLPEPKPWQFKLLKHLGG